MPTTDDTIQAPARHRPPHVRHIARGLGLAALLALAGAGNRLHAAGIDVQPSTKSPASATAGIAGDSPRQLLVRFREGASALTRKRSHLTVGASVARRFQTFTDLEVVTVPPEQSLDAAIAAYRKRPDVVYAEPNYPLYALETPNDPRWGELWNLANTGQDGGQAGADIAAPAAWDLTRGSHEVVVVVIDTGIDYRHEDLAANVWANPADCDDDGRDDDADGWVDDCHGIDTANGDSDPLDDHGHGTHVAGTIGAVGDNGLGVTGVNHAVSIAACKFLDAAGRGYTDGAIACLDWVARLRDRGVRVVATNNSWGGGSFSQALADAIAVQQQRGVLFIAAAGNAGANIDAAPFYPAGYDLPNLVAVAATDRQDRLAWFSNVGRRSVDVGAPGVGILSTVPNEQYGIKSGTSMAAPHVTGLAALLAAADPTRDWAAIRNLLLTSGDDLPALADTVSGRRVNAYRALTCTDSSLLARLAPASDEAQGQIGTPIPLAALHLRCAEAAGPVTVVVSPDGTGVTLGDEGTDSDQVAGDGTYAGTWTPTTAGTHILTFPDGDSVTVHVPEGSGYTARYAELAWRDLVGTSLDLTDDGVAAVVTPFPIHLGGTAYEIAQVSANGLIGFGAPVPGPGNETLPVPSGGAILAPFWDDLLPTPRSGANVFVQTLGTAPQRELVVEWRNLPAYGGCSSSTTVRFQAVLFESRPDVLFNYLNVAPGALCALAAGGSATVGLQTAPDRATVFSFDAAVLRNGSALLWTADDSAGCTGDADCDDGVACTLDRCIERACERLPDDSQCPAGGRCSAGVCDPAAGCVVVPTPECPACDNDRDCDDDVACTTDHCVAGLCAHTPDDARCDDGDACTLDRCDALRGCETAGDTCPSPCAPTASADDIVGIDDRHGAGRLRARLTLGPAGGFAGAPVSVALRNAQGDVIATQTIAGLRRHGRRFVFHSSQAGVQHLVVKPLAGGQLRVRLDARHFFEAPTAAELPAALEVRVRDASCFRHIVTSTLVAPGGE